MDHVNQCKLTKSEWISIEVPVSPAEKRILKMIQEGHDNVNITRNDFTSLFSFLKIDFTETMEDYLYNKFFAPLIAELVQKHNAPFIGVDAKMKSTMSKITICKADSIRIERNALETLTTETVYEILLLTITDKILKCRRKSDNQWMLHYFTLQKLSMNKISHINRHILASVKSVLKQFEEELDYYKIISKSAEYIEQNGLLLKHEDQTLYEHQKEIFTVFKNPAPKLILYIAPTGTGKTMTPIGLASSKKIIFVCAARHVGLALARSSISMGKKVAFAFGCESANDIRLHYYAAKVYTKNYRTGGIQKVDNSVGDNVEIMICDIKSYLYAMYYMIAFTTRPKRDSVGEIMSDELGDTILEPDYERLLTYWDEPTITMDYLDHELHATIKKNWTENVIPNIVLSSATLPKIHEISETVADFKEKFGVNAIVHSIVSHDCRKTIPIIDSDGFVVAPHYMNADYTQVLKTVEHCENYLTILRYFDLNECAQFILYVNERDLIPKQMKIERRFGSLSDVNMQSIKLYYLETLKNVKAGEWAGIYAHFVQTRKRKIPYNINVDAKGEKITRSQSADYVSQMNNKQMAMAGAPLIRANSVQVVPTQVTQTFPFDTNSVYITTKDSYTLTDGPTIYLTQDVLKVAKFCIQQANIPPKVMTDIMTKIMQNNVLNKKINELEKELETMIGNSDSSAGDTEAREKKKGRESEEVKNKLSKKAEKASTDRSSVKMIQDELKALSAAVKNITLNTTFIPNAQEHLKKWADHVEPKNAFTCDVDEDVVSKIMLLDGVDDSLKVLLMMGIGVLMSHDNIAYTEIMKKLADDQRLFMIITSSDYIYGTNYQFCHGYIGKDLNLTQEKILQAMGRIGRRNVQQTYTVRFRDSAQIIKLFNAEPDKPEVINMNRLFNSREVSYENGEYKYLN
jgi:hypothetical protein